MRVKLLCLRRVLFCDLFDRVIKEAYNDNINHTEICKTERGQENRPLVPQSANPEIPKCQFGTLDELAILELVAKNPTIKQQEFVEATGKSIATVKRLMKSLQDKNYIRRENGKRYGKWEVLL